MRVTLRLPIGAYTTMAAKTGGRLRLRFGSRHGRWLFGELSWHRHVCLCSTTLLRPHPCRPRPTLSTPLLSFCLTGSLFKLSDIVAIFTSA